LKGEDNFCSHLDIHIAYRLCGLVVRVRFDLQLSTRDVRELNFLPTSGTHAEMAMELKSE
jgi:hypothetical protein